MARIKKKKLRGDVEDLDITSLLDILVILLVFLLKSYNTSLLDIKLIDNLALPISQSKKYGNNTVTIQVNKEKKIWVNDEFVGFWGNGNDKVVAALKKGQTRDLENKEEIDPKKRGKTVNLVFDESLSFEVVDSIMETANNAGLGSFKFIVKAQGS